MNKGYKLILICQYRTSQGQYEKYEVFDILDSKRFKDEQISAKIFPNGEIMEIRWKWLGEEQRAYDWYNKELGTDFSLSDNELLYQASTVHPKYLKATGEKLKRLILENNKSMDEGG